MKINNRRYLGSKSKLVEKIKEAVYERVGIPSSFLDLFAGTGSVGASFNSPKTQVMTNDIMLCNYVCHYAWLNNEPVRYGLVQSIIDIFNSNEFLSPNYFSDNFGNRYVTEKTAMRVGNIRETIDVFSRLGIIKGRERCILLASLIYALDRSSDTCGHYEAFFKRNKDRQPFVMLTPDVDPLFKNTLNKQYRLDANKLVTLVKPQVVYIDPPYNSRQYSSLYHVLETLIDWTKPELSGIAMKPEIDRRFKSEYSTVRAADAFENLINNIDAELIVVSFNNMFGKGCSRSSNLIVSQEFVTELLSRRGKLDVVEIDHRPFTAGKSDIKEHKEILYLCKIRSN